MAGRPDSTNPFPNPSSGIPMMFNSETKTRQIKIDEFETFCVFIPFNYGQRKGVYPESPYGFDETMNPAKESMVHWMNFHYILTLIAQNAGTPYIKSSILKNQDLTMKDFNNVLKNERSYENFSVLRSTYFRDEVASKVAAIKHLDDIKIPDPVGQDDNLEIDSEIDLAYKREDNNIRILNQRLGVYGNYEHTSSARAKFDIIFMPLFEHPDRKNYDERGIFGFIAFFIKYDPLWNMREALHMFVSHYNSWCTNKVSKVRVEFNADSRILDTFKQDNYLNFYKTHFGAYVKADKHLWRISNGGQQSIDLGPDNTMKLSSILQFHVALKHAAKYLGVKKKSNWYAFYDQIGSTNAEYLTFKPEHEPYIYDYHTFIWNAREQLKFNHNTSTSTSDKPSTVGIFFEYFPWVTMHKRILSSELVGLERIHMSMLATNRTDIMDIDLLSTFGGDNTAAPKADSELGNYYVNQMYDDTHEKLMSINTNREDSFIHSEHNVLVAVAERVRNDLQTQYKAIEQYRTSHPRMEQLLFPQSRDGLKSLTVEQVQYVNRCLSELNEHNQQLHRLQRRILDFSIKRIFTLANSKALTPSILSTIQYIEGKTIRTALPGDNQSTLDVNDIKPLTERKVDQYQLNMVDNNLDITAHGAMYFVTSTRYFGYNAFCTFDTYKLQIGLLDAFRSEFNMHWNYGSFGPFGTSKSRALEVFKQNSLPEVVTTITTQSLLANTASKDMSDRIRITDEASMMLATNSKAGGSYSPEAAAMKSEMTTGYSVRSILDPGKNFVERITRRIVSIQIGCIAITSNILITDLALVSRFHATITQNESQQQKPPKNKTGGPATTQSILEKQNYDRNKVNLSDMILHTPSEVTKKTINFFTESMQIQQCLGILLWKLIQMGILHKPSGHMICIVTIICKYLKTTMNISVPVRTVQRIQLFAINLSIITAINILFNTPGINMDLHDIPFKIEMLMRSAPYLYCTLQMILLSFSMHSCEFLRQTDTQIVEGIVEHMKINTFPTTRINTLFKYRNIERMKYDNPLYANININAAVNDLSVVEKDPLWTSFRDLDTVPLELLYAESKGLNAFTTFWRSNAMPGSHDHTKPKKMNTAMLFNPQAAREPDDLNTIATIENDANDNSTLIDLAYWSLGMTHTQLLENLTRHFKGQINADQVKSSLQEVETMKINVRTIMPMSRKDLKEYQKLHDRALLEGQELPLLPRFERNMNCLEVDTNQNICVSAFIFGEILHRPGNNHVILQSIKSFMYRGMRPRTILTGSELSDNYDIEFSMHELRDDDIKHSSEDSLRIIDPSLIHASMDTQNRQLVERITTSMRKMAEARDSIVDRTIAKTSNLSNKEKETRFRQAQTIVTNIEANTVNTTLEANEREITQTDFVTLVGLTNDFNENSNQPITDILSGVLDHDENTNNDTTQRFIYIDIDDWAFVNNCLDHGIPLRIDPNTRTYQFKTTNDAKWEPIQTPLQLMEYHRQTKPAEFVTTTLSQTHKKKKSKKPAAPPAPGGAFRELFDELSAQSLPATPATPSSQQPHKRKERPGSNETTTQTGKKPRKNPHKYLKDVLINPV